MTQLVFRRGYQGLDSYLSSVATLQIKFGFLNSAFKSILPGRMTAGSLASHRMSLQKAKAF